MLLRDLIGAALKLNSISYQPAPTNGMGAKEHFNLQDIPGL